MLSELYGEQPNAVKMAARLLFRLFWMLVATMVTRISVVNPKMKPYIFGERQRHLHSTHRPCLAQTLLYFPKNVASKGGSRSFVGTKKQAQEPIATEAELSCKHALHQPALVWRYAHQLRHHAPALRPRSLRLWSRTV